MDRAVKKRLFQWRMLPLLAVLLLAGNQAFQAAAGAVNDHIRESQRLLSSGDLEGAEREAMLALEGSKDPSDHALAWAILGTIRLQQNHEREGIKDLEKAIRLDHRLVGARLNLAAAYQHLGETGRARVYYREALGLKPDNPAARMELAQLEAAAKNYGASLQVAEPAISTFRATPEGILTLATDYSGLQRKASLTALVDDWKRLTGVPESRSLEFARILAKDKFLKEAIDVLEMYAINGNRPGVELSLALATLYRQRGDVKAASNFYASALESKDDCVPCLQGLASTAEKDGETEKALSYLIRARKLAPEDADVLFQFGRVCLERDLRDDGIEALEKAVALNPDDDHYLYVLASGYVAAAHYAKARPLFDKLVARHPNDDVPQYALGTVLYLQGDFEAAATTLKRSIDLNASQVGAYYYLGLIAEKKRDYASARRIFEDLLKRHPEHVPSYAELGTVLVEMKQYADAQPILEKAIQLDPSSAQAHYQMAVLLARLGKQEESQKEAAVARACEKQHRTEDRQLRLLP